MGLAAVVLRAALVPLAVLAALAALVGVVLVLAGGIALIAAGTGIG